MLQDSGFLKALRDGAPALAVAIVVFLLAALVATLLQPTHYSARSAMVVSPAAFLDPAQTDLLPELAGTVAELAHGEAVLERTREAYVQAADGPGRRADRARQADLEWLRGRLQARVLGTSSVIELSALVESQRDAADLAAAAEGALVDFVAGARTGAQPAGASSPPGVRLVTLSSGQPGGRESPTPLRNGLLGLFAGAALGAIAALPLGWWRRRRTPLRFAQHARAPWLGMASGQAADASRAVQRLLDGFEAARESAGLVILVSGGPSPHGIALIAESIVRELGDGALLVDGQAHPRELALALGTLESHATPGGAAQLGAITRGWRWRGGDWVAERGPHESLRLMLASLADEPADQSEPALVGSRVQRLWPDQRFVVISGPDASRNAELQGLLAAADCLLLVIGADAARDDLDFAGALAREATADHLLVGVMGRDHRISHGD